VVGGTAVSDILAETSRTFAIPIMGLPQPLRDAVAGAYLQMRAIDEVEDHPELPPSAKARLLTGISHRVLGAGRLETLLEEFARVLPPVTLRLPEWLALVPPGINARVADATATMATRMAAWTAAGWAISTEQDLDQYTYAVAGAVGLLLADLWSWHDGTGSDRSAAVEFGRGLQLVNIIGNRPGDLARSADFFPDGWDRADMIRLARGKLAVADRYVAALPAGPALDFCRIPLSLAHATLAAFDDGNRKLTRAAVLRIAARTA
jgi:farnesyl-diphosphate farnesyltransferase